MTFLLQGMQQATPYLCIYNWRTNLLLLCCCDAGHKRRHPALKKRQNQYNNSYSPRSGTAREPGSWAGELEDQHRRWLHQHGARRRNQHKPPWWCTQPRRWSNIGIDDSSLRTNFLTMYTILLMTLVKWRLERQRTTLMHHKKLN